MFQQIKNKILDSQSIAIFTHIRADGDCLGAGMALYYLCKNLKKEVSVFNADIIHNNFDFLTKGIIKKQLDKDYDLFIAVDCAALNRLGSFESAFKAKKNTINIDHHISNENYAMINYVESSASSACEVLFDFFEQTNTPLTNEIAHTLLCGVSSDTGCFKHSNTTPKTHKIASKLLEYKFDIEKMYYYLFRIKSKAEINLIVLIYQNLQYFHNGQIVISGIDKRDVKRVNASFKDDPHLVEELIGIEGVKIAITYKQDLDNGYNISFRSAGDVNVCNLAKVFGGGGHEKAAGCKIYAPKNKMIEMLANEAGKFIL